MAAASMALKMVCVVMACMMVAAPFAQVVEAAITCPFVLRQITPCGKYLKGAPIPPPQSCCAGVRAINAAARYRADRQAACRCLKGLAGDLHINWISADSLPGRCGANIGPYLKERINRSMDCSMVN